LGERFVALRMATGMASSVARIVKRVAMFVVSMSGSTMVPK